MDIMQYYLNHPQAQQSMGGQQPQQMPPAAPQSMQFNPITAGTQAGMEAARRSLDMDAKERQRALGMGMMRFAQGLTQRGHGPGMEGALSRINASLMPAVEQYNQEEDKVAGIKSALMQQQFELERYQQDRQDKMRRQAQEEALERERLYLLRERVNTSGQTGQRRGKPGEEYVDQLETPAGVIDVSKSPVLSKGARTSFSKQLNQLNTASREVDDIFSEFNSLMESTKENVFSPIPGGSLLGKFPNTIKDLINITSSPENDISKEVAKRKTLLARMDRMQTTMESALKGSPPGEMMMKTFREKGLYPNEKDAPNVLQAKLEQMSKEMNTKRAIIDYSLQSGRLIKNIPDSLISQNNANPNSGNLQNDDNLSDEELDREIELEKQKAGG